MIIGKSLTALGGGGLQPEIRVTAKAGALLNLHYKDSSIILQSYQLMADETQHTFIVDVSASSYIVEDKTNNASETVLVDAVSVFNIEIEYGFLLYKNGNEYTDTTGGWAQCTLKYNDRVFTTTYSSFTKDTENGLFKFTLNKNNINALTGIAVGCSKQIDVTNYSEMGIEYEYLNLSSDSTGGIYGTLYAGTVLGDYYYAQAGASKNILSGEVLQNVRATTDISALSGNKYIWIHHENASGSPVTVHSEMRISKVWLK